MRATVTGAGGFIGHHLVKRLVKDGHHVKGIDLKKPEFEKTSAHEFYEMDLRTEQGAYVAAINCDHFYALAADMGGMGFISSNHADILYNNASINLNSIKKAGQLYIKKYFFASSACIYPVHLQSESKITYLEEDDAYPANPEDAYGWEKLVTGELACKYYQQDYNLQTRVARFHNVYGPLGAWKGGREKAPAAICRKIARAKLAGHKEIEVWGDGKQLRSFMFINDCIEGIIKLMNSDHCEPINLGTDDSISINRLVNVISIIAGYNVKIKHVKGPQGVRSRSSSNLKIKSVLNWEPTFSLERGLEITYEWIEDQVRKELFK